MSDALRPDMGSTLRRMFVQGEWSDAQERPYDALQRLMRELDDEAAKVGMVVHGDVAISVSEPSVFAGAMRQMRLEADVVTR